MPAPLVLVPPSEGKAPGGRAPWSPDSGRFRRLAPLRREALAALTSPGASLGVRGELLERAQAALAAAVDGTAPSLPAWRRYTGVVWQHLDPATLGSAERRRIVVPSALLGLAAGDDPVPDYRGRFTTRGLTTLWRDAVTDALVAARRPIVDLLAAEQAAVIEWRRLPAVHVRFLSATGGGAAGHAAKAVKGVAARLVLTDGPDALDGFSWEGWTARRADGGWDVVAPVSGAR